MSDRVITSERDVDVRLVVLSRKEMICGMREHYIWEDTVIVAQYSVIQDWLTSLQAGTTGFSAIAQKCEETS